MQDQANSTQIQSKTARPKVLSVFSLVMINVIAVDSLRNLPIGAEYGFALVFFYLLAAIAFFIPIALVTAELATGWPTTGGLYVWVREAFGKRWGFLAIWLQWIYNVVWYPTILAFLAATFAYLINPHLADNLTYTLVTILIVFWGATFINCLGMKASSLLSALGAIVGTILPMVFIAILGIIWVAQGKPMQITVSWHSVLPDIQSVKNISFLIAIIFGLIGLEMSAVHAGDVKNPRRDYPRALLISAVIILITLIFASLAIAVVMPSQQISLVSGLIQAFSVFFAAFHMQWMTPVIVIMIIIGGISGVGAWIIGPTKGLLVASEDGCLPAYFGKINKKGAPVRLLLAQGIVFTLLCTVFLFMPSINTSYWVLSALTAQLGLLVYIILFAAAIRLRYRHSHVERAYRIPGGNIGIWLLAGVGILTCCAAIAIGFIPPAQLHFGNVYKYETTLLLGLIIFCGLPFMMRKDSSVKLH